MQEPIGGSMGEEIVDKERPDLSSPIIGRDDNQLRTERPTREVAKVRDVRGCDAAMHLVRTWYGDVSHRHRTVGHGAQNGIEGGHHGMTPRTDCMIRIEIGRGRLTPSTTRMPADTANAATDHVRGSPSGTPAGATPYSIRRKRLHQEANKVTGTTR